MPRQQTQYTLRKLAKEQRLYAIADGVAAQLIAQYYPQTPQQLQRIKRLDAIIYILQTADGTKEVLRLSSSYRWHSAGVAHAYNAWQQAGISAPTVRAWGEWQQLSYVLMDFLPNQPFSFSLPYKVKLHTMHDMGKLLAHMSAVSLQGFGWLDKEGKGAFSTWQAYLAQRYLQSWLAGEGIISRQDLRRMQVFVVSLAGLPAKATMLHGDFKPENMFIDARGTITALTDPMPIGGDILWEIAVCSHFLYREQARQGLTVADPIFAALRSEVVRGYEAARGQAVNTEEVRRIRGYEILYQTNKIERLIDRRCEAREIENNIRYLRHMLQKWQ